MSRRPLDCCCRWCGADLVHTGRPGRPAVWCDTTCRDTYVRRLGSRDYQGSVALVEYCDGACPLDRATTSFGPLLWPGLHAAAATIVATLTHGHPVTVKVEPSEISGNVHTADDGALRLPGTRGARLAVGG